MFTLKVGKAETYQDIEQNETRLRVPFGIYRPADKETDGHDGFELVEERHESFPLGTPIEEVQETLQRHLTVYTEDHIRYEGLKEQQERLNDAGALAEEISGITIG